MSDEILKVLLDMKSEISEVKTTGLATLEQAKKTNGRVTSLEVSNLNLSNLVSRHNGEILKAQQERKKELEDRERIEEEKEKEKRQFLYVVLEKVAWLMLGFVIFKFASPVFLEIIKLLN